MGYQLCLDSVRGSVRGLIRTSQEARSLVKTLVGSGEHTEHSADIIRGDVPGVKYCSTGCIHVFKVRTTSLVCLLGVGIGLGSYFLYKLWNKVFPPPGQSLPPRGANRSRPNTPTSLSDDVADTVILLDPTGKEQVLPNSPDSGCVMGNTDSNLTSTASTPTANQNSQFFTSHEQDLRNRRGKQGSFAKSSDDSDITEKEYNGYIVIDRNLKNSNIPSPDKQNSHDERTESASFDLISFEASQSFCNIKSPAVEPSEQTVLKCQEQFSQDEFSGARSRTLNSSSLSTLVDNEGNKAMQGSMFSSISTDLGFVSGNYSSDTRDNSQEPELNQSMSQTTNPNLAQNNNMKLQKQENVDNFMSFKEINSPNQPNYSMADFQNYPTQLLDGNASFSFLNESIIHSASNPHSKSFGGGLDLSSASQKTPVQSAIKQLSKSHNTGNASTGLRKNCSFTSQVSTTSEGSYYFYGGHSVACGENFSGRTTPDLGFDVGFKTETNINDLQSEILMLRSDLDEMTEHIQNLNSRDNLSYLPEVDGDSDFIKHSRGHKPASLLINRYRTRSFAEGSSVHSLNFTTDQQDDVKPQTPNQGDFMWDYQSDLASGVPQNFVASRPIVANKFKEEASEYGSPVNNLDHIRKYLHEQSQSVNLTNEGGRNLSQDHDLYIDDGFSYNYGSNHMPFTNQNNHNNSNSIISSKSKNQTNSSSSHTNLSSSQTLIKPQQHLCTDCIYNNDCCTNCGKHINSNNTSNNNNNRTESSGTTTGKVTASTNTVMSLLNTQSDSTQTESVYTNQSNTVAVVMPCTSHGNVRIPPVGRAASKSPIPVIQPTTETDTFAACKNNTADSGIGEFRPKFNSSPVCTSRSGTYADSECNSSFLLASGESLPSYLSSGKCNSLTYTSPTGLNNDAKVGGVCAGATTLCFHDLCNLQMLDCKHVNTFNSTPLCVSSLSSAKEGVNYKHGSQISTEEVRDCVNRYSDHRQTPVHSHNSSCLCPHIIPQNCQCQQCVNRHPNCGCVSANNYESFSHANRDSNSKSVHTCQLSQNIFDRHIGDTSSFNQSANSSTTCLEHNTMNALSTMPGIAVSAKCNYQCSSSTKSSAKSQIHTPKKTIDRGCDAFAVINEEQVINKKVTMSSSDQTDKKKWEVVNIGEIFEISDYIKKEWKGETDKAVTIRKVIIF